MGGSLPAGRYFGVLLAPFAPVAFIRLVAMDLAGYNPAGIPGVRPYRQSRGVWGTYRGGACFVHLSTKTSKILSFLMLNGLAKREIVTRKTCILQFL
jgi:hypothetical protein